jgi:Glycosyltransferase family 43
MSFLFNRGNKVLLISTLFFFFSFAAQMPAKFRKNKVKPRGVSNRNRGLEWIRANASEGVLYFADDDNTYDLDIFDEVRIEAIFSNFVIVFIYFCHPRTRGKLEII